MGELSNRLQEIQRNNRAVRFLTYISMQTYPTSDGIVAIEFNCKDLTIRNDGDYELLIGGSVLLQPGESVAFGADEGEYQTGNIQWSWGNLIGPGTKQYFTVIRKNYAE